MINRKSEQTEESIERKKMRLIKSDRRFLSYLIIILVFFLTTLEKGESALRSAIFLDISRVEPHQRGWKNTWAVGFGIVLPVTPNLSCFFNFSRWQFAVSPQDSRLLGGKLILSPLAGGIYFRLLPRSFLSPVFSIGGGYLFSQYRPAEKGWVTIPEIIKLSKRVRGNFNWEAGAGIAIRVSRRLSLWLQATHYQSLLKIDTTVVDLNLGTIKNSQNCKFSPTLYHLGLQLIF